MCGIAGYLNKDGQGSAEMAEQMAARLLHRGPDSGGAWSDGFANLAFRRLAILDLTETGNQPMVSKCGNYTVVFNGEVYNFEELRKELGGVWRGHSDTEVMLEAMIRWGVNEAARRFNGMFAIALWNRQTRELSLLRDRMGKKPLYYGWRGNSFLFGSELKALSAHPDFEGKLDRNALAHYFRYAAIPSPLSIYQGISKLPPGCYLKVKLDTAAPLIPERYWSAKELVQQPKETFSFEEAQTVLDRKLREAVRLRQVADVPLGAFLSGGIDSSLIVALMQAQSAQPIRTFTIGFEEAEFNEATAAKAVASHLKTSHTEWILTPERAREEIPKIPFYYDEPFADSSQIPTMLVSSLARKEVTVALTGDGGDELFAGYNRHFWIGRVWNVIAKLSPEMRQRLARSLKAMPAGLVKKMTFVSNPMHKLDRITRLLGSENLSNLYQRVISQWNEPNELVIGGREPSLWIDEPEKDLSIEEWMLFRDLVTYLPDDILTKVDRASMAYSLEVRSPFLDPEIIQFAWRLPLSYKMKQGKGKLILRELLSKYLPRDLYERPKQGFGIPIGAWLRGPLRDWAEELLNEERLKREGYLQPSMVRKKWEAHLEGKENAENALWTVLMFQSWLERINANH